MFYVLRIARYFLILQNRIERMNSQRTLYQELVELENNNPFAINCLIEEFLSEQ